MHRKIKLKEHPLLFRSSANWGSEKLQTDFGGEEAKGDSKCACRKRRIHHSPPSGTLLLKTFESHLGYISILGQTLPAHQMWDSAESLAGGGGGNTVGIFQSRSQFCSRTIQQLKLISSQGGPKKETFLRGWFESRALQEGFPRTSPWPREAGVLHSQGGNQWREWMVIDPPGATQPQSNEKARIQCPGFSPLTLVFLGTRKFIISN